MNIGLFTDTYFPQVSGVATSIKTLKNDLESKGHSVYIFTTTDPHVSKDTVEPNIFRFTSVPFISFTDRRIAVRGLFHAYQVAKELDLDIIHTQTEFSMGNIGKFVARSLKIPCIHTYHTMYEDYLHYILNGKVLRPYHVKQISRAFLSHMAGVVAPSERVIDKLNSYGIKSPIRIIPTGVDLTKYDHQVTADVRQLLHLSKNQPVLLSLSRVAYEKRVDLIIDAMPAILEAHPDAVLVVVGDGPAMGDLKAQVAAMRLNDHVVFAGEVNNDEVANYYHMADLFVSASDSESQGLTYIEALASGIKIVAKASPYTSELLDDPSVGVVFSDNADLAKKVNHYLDHPNSYDDQNIREAKLYDISADHFGDQILTFYHESQELYEELNYDSVED